MSTPNVEVLRDAAPAHRMPARKPTSSDRYDIYPAFPLASGRIALGYDALAKQLHGQSRIVIDGYAGVHWDELRKGLDAALMRQGKRTSWASTTLALKPRVELDVLVGPFLGGNDPLFGTRCTLALRDFFDESLLAKLQPDPEVDIGILYGPGAALAGWGGFLIYVDLPKSELHSRASMGFDTNLGVTEALEPKHAYKRSYFVDWPVLNRHKAEIFSSVDIIVDGQRPCESTFITGTDLREGLMRVSRTAFRVRPWFEPGPWGGQWIKKHLPELPRDVPNYAWSFELIVPENGLVFESDGLLLEVSFDTLMFYAHEAVLGECAARFGLEFPIRFDWLDTVQGDNLSLQVHPRPDYIKKHFGESFTQDETYYILDCQPEASVYLGFRDDVDPQTFRAELERSLETANPVKVEDYVQKHQVKKGDLFLIPSGTIHCSGAGSLVLEISATPYIFTFKMYDWLRLDLEGKMRPLNIARAFENLNFNQAGEQVRLELLSMPRVLEEGDGWRVVHLPTHEDHFYDVHRLEFNGNMTVATEGSPHVLCVVEGSGVMLVTEEGVEMKFSFAETFVVPAATGRYAMRNTGTDTVKLVKAFVKPGRGP